jgi:chromosome segregation ATPase
VSAPSGDSFRDERVHDQSAALERIAAQLHIIQSRIESLESRFDSVSGAHLALAGRLEDTSAQLARVSRLETALDTVRNEASLAVDERTGGLATEIGVTRKANERTASELGRAVAGLSGRIDVAEASLAKLDLAGRDMVIQRQLTDLARRIGDLETSLDELARRPPRVEPTTAARVDELSAHADALEAKVNDWQARIEDHAARVRAAELSAERQVEEAASLHEAHHTTVEAQRLAETRVNEALSRMATEAEERWSLFMAERAHDWSALRARLELVAADLDETQGSLVATDQRLAALSGTLDSETAARADEMIEIRDAVLKAFAQLRDAVGDASRVIEEGVPYDQRAEVIEERQLALRRALRARRTPSP